MLYGLGWWWIGHKVALICQTLLHVVSNWSCILINNAFWFSVWAILGIKCASIKMTSINIMWGWCAQCYCKALVKQFENEVCLAQHSSTSVDEFTSIRFPTCLILSLDCISEQHLLKELTNMRKNTNVYACINTTGYSYQFIFMKLY